MLSVLADYLAGMGLSQDHAAIGARALLVLGTGFLAWLSYFVTWFILRRIVRAVVTRTYTTRDDIILDHGIFRHLSHLMPAIVIAEFIPEILSGQDHVASLILTLSYVYMAVIIVMVVDAMLNAGRDIYNSYTMAQQMPINAFIQVAKLLVYLAGLVWVISLLIGKSPLTFLAGLGAATAVLLLIFQAPILGFVAGIQIAANRMVSVGDWITMKQHGIDGDVEEIGLTTVKVRNFDKTVITVPTQALVTGAFQNWRGMQDTGGRRIKRSIHVDTSTIRYLTEEEIARLSKVQVLKPYIDAKTAELEDYNRRNGTDPSSPVNGRRMTNVGTFRAWIEAYLKHHPMISKDLTFLIRQLQPEPTGLPIEIYVFTTTTIWREYERIQADIFDQILAAAPEFGLRVYQQPSGADLAGLGLLRESPQ